MPLNTSIQPEPKLSHVILDSLAASLVVLDRTGVVIFVNKAWIEFARKHGIPGAPEIGVGTNYLEIARQANGPYSADSEAACEGIKAVLEGKQPEFLLTYPCPTDAQKRWFLLQVTPMADATTGAAIISHQDITAQKKAEDMLRLSELRYRRFFETASDGILIVDTQSGEVLDVNSYLIDYLGCSLRDILGRRLWKIRALKALAADEAAFQDLKSHDFLHIEDLTLTAADGQPRHVEFVSTAYMADFKRVIQCNLRDITARRQAEKALAESQMRLELAVRASGVGPWAWDLSANEFHFSPEGKNQLGHGDDEFSSQLSEWQDRLHPDDLDPVMAEVKEYLARPEGGLDLEFRLRHKDGTYRWINSRGQLFRDADGKPGRLLGCHLDITERKSLEEQFRQAQKMESIGRLAGGVAHDFNNLLTIILGYSDILLSEPEVDEATRDSLTEIKRAGERAASLTRQLLAFSRKQVLEPAFLDCNAVVGDCEKMLKRLLGEDVELITYLAPDLGHIRADAGQLEQVLMNLVINARDAMPQGGKVTLETGSTELEADFVHRHPGLKPGRYVVLTVSDTGCGMDEETKAHLFEPFFTTKEQGKGTGLGLAMVFGFIKQSDGHVAVTSEPGEGTAFKIYLPEVEMPSLPGRDSISENPVPAGSETILLVEDEEGVRTLARNILQNRGYTVLAAGRGDEALALAQNHPDPIHLLISDVVMPGVGGRQLAEDITALRPGIKTLFVSGYTDDTVMRHGIQTSETAFLHKPFTVEALPAKVRKVLDQ